MLIAEAAQQAGVNVQTIRYYERRGLLLASHPSHLELPAVLARCDPGRPLHQARPGSGFHTRRDRRAAGVARRTAARSRPHPRTGGTKASSGRDQDRRAAVHGARPLPSRAVAARRARRSSARLSMRWITLSRRYDAPRPGVWHDHRGRRSGRLVRARRRALFLLPPELSRALSRESVFIPERRIGSGSRGAVARDDVHLPDGSRGAPEHRRAVPEMRYGSRARPCQRAADEDRVHLSDAPRSRAGRAGLRARSAEWRSSRGR